MYCLFFITISSNCMPTFVALQRPLPGWLAQILNLCKDIVEWSSCILSRPHNVRQFEKYWSSARLLVLISIRSLRHLFRSIFPCKILKFDICTSNTCSTIASSAIWVKYAQRIFLKDVEFERLSKFQIFRVHD